MLKARKSWRYRWRRQCRAKWEQRSSQIGCEKPQARPKNPPSPKDKKHALIVEAHESARKRLESALPKDLEDHVAEKGFNSRSQYKLVHKFVPMRQSMTNTDAKAAVDKGWEKLEKLAAWQLSKVKAR